MFSGLSAFPLTPVNEHDLNEAAFVRLIERLVAANVDSIGVLGSTGNYAYLTMAERVRVVRLAVEHADKVPVVVGIDALRTRDSDAGRRCAVCWRRRCAIATRNVALGRVLHSQTPRFLLPTTGCSAPRGTFKVPASLGEDPTITQIVLWIKIYRKGIFALCIWLRWPRLAL